MSNQGVQLFKNHSGQLTWFGRFFGVTAVIWAVGSLLLLLGVLISPSAFLPRDITGMPILRENELNAFRCIYLFAVLIQGFFVYYCLRGVQTLFKFFADVAWDMAYTEQQRERRKQEIRSSPRGVDKSGF